jgi:alkylation response protein AidB-like acyl-CoA dehydrogenase
MKFDNRFGWALVLALVLQTAGGLIWAGRAAARLEEVEQRLHEQQPVAERLARLEVRADDARAALERIERRLDGHKQR